ncbi:rRNA methyltransferase [Candidatus Parcubacteria bacterium]|nr:MAG: rRNA methyltransferase [Candidatus Parcubacteria bacterium]
MTIKLIESTKNPTIKNIIKLRKSSERKKQKLVIVEGIREISIALMSGLEIDSLFLAKNKELELKEIKENKITLLEDKVFSNISQRQNPDGHLALFKEPISKISKFKVPENPLILILEAIEKPGNLGAIMRTVDAAGVDAVIINDPALDIYSANAVRSSQGTIFTTPLFLANIKETSDFCKKHKIQMLATTPDAANEYLDEDMTHPTALIFGTEATGLSKKWLEIANKTVKIYMNGKIDSLNLSVSAGVVVFEAKRQRGLIPN